MVKIIGGVAKPTETKPAPEPKKKKGRPKKEADK